MSLQRRPTPYRPDSVERKLTQLRQCTARSGAPRLLERPTRFHLNRVDLIVRDPTSMHRKRHGPVGEIARDNVTHVKGDVYSTHITTTSGAILLLRPILPSNFGCLPVLKGHQTHLNIASSTSQGCRMRRKSCGHGLPTKRCER